MSYLCGAEAVGIGVGDAARAATAGRDWQAAEGPTAGAAATLARGGEEGRTRSLKLSPPRVSAMLGLGKRWRGWRGFLLHL